jgi:putative ABC transport system permease protein
MDRLRQPLFEALRAIRHDPLHAAAATLTLTLGVAALAALGAVAQGVLLRPLPYDQPDRLVAVLHGPTVNAPMSPADYRDYRRLATSFVGLAAAQAWGANLSAGGRTDRIPALQVTGTLFALLGRPPLLGRSITEADEQRDARVAVLAHGLWTRRFGGDASILGRTLLVNGESHTVIGVMPPDFRFAPFWQTRAEIWVPLSLAGRVADRDGRSLRVFGRLREHVDLATARVELATINDRLARDWPDSNRGLTTGAVPLEEKALAGVRPLVVAVSALAVGLLLIAAVNLAMLAVARRTARRTEYAIREALGASRGRIVGAAFAEALVIGVVGIAGAIGLAAGGTRLLVSMLPPDSLPPHAQIDLSAPIVALAVLTAAGILALSNLLPLAWMRTAPATALSGTRGAVGDRSATRIRGLLVGAEVMLAFVLAASALLLARTVVHLQRVDLGFEAAGLQAVSVSLDGAIASTPEARSAFFETLVERVAALPGVVAASAINHLPLAGDLWLLGFQVEGAPPAQPGEGPRAAYRVVLPGYFGAMRQPLLRGRAFDDSDRSGSLPVVIVNARLAGRHWPDGDPVGRRLRLGDEWLTVVGVVGDVPQATLVDPIEDEVYLPLAQRQIQAAARMPMTLVLRTDASVAVDSTVRETVWRLDRQAAVYDSAAFDDVLAAETWRERLGATTSAVFASVALLLAAVGVSSVVAYAVTRRWREFGVRLALGAQSRQVVSLAVREAAVPVVVGLAAGLGLVLAASRVLSSVLVGVSATDPLAIGLAATTLLAVTLAAAWRPARRATRVDPGIALRDA